MHVLVHLFLACLVALLLRFTESFSVNEKRNSGRSTSTKWIKNVKSGFEIFEDAVHERISRAQNDGETKGAAPAEKSYAPFALDKNMMEQLAATKGEIDQTRMNESRKLLFNAQRTGGLIILELGEDESEILDRMWNSTHKLHDVNEDKANLTLVSKVRSRRFILFPEDIHSNKTLFIPQRHQTLARDVTPGSKRESTGYDYIETSIRRRDGVFVPENLDDALSEAFRSSFQLLKRLGDLVTSSLLSGSTSMTRDAIANLIETMVDDGRDIGIVDETSHSCTMQRICRYAAVPNDLEMDEIETLKGHTDWTILTLVPVSQVPGLEIYDPEMRSWVRPELSLARDAADDSDRHSSFVIVLAGKWMELLTDGNVKAAVHRVVASKGEPRCSTPFFYRPRQEVPLSIQEHFGKDATRDGRGKNSDASRAASRSSTRSEDPMGSFLRKRYES